MDFSRLKSETPFFQNTRLLILLGIAIVLGIVVLFVRIDCGGSEYVGKLKSKNVEERLKAIDELAANGSKDELRAVGELVGDADVRVACRALLAVAGSGLETRREYVLRAAEDEREEVQQVAMVALGRLGDKEQDGEFLAGVVRDRKRKPAVRAAAAQAIGLLRAWDQRGALLDVLDAHTPNVRPSQDPLVALRGAAAAALRRITHRSFGFKAKADPSSPEQRRKVASMRRALR